MTVHRPFFTKDTSNPKVLKGASIQRYYWTETMSQGEIEYVDEAKYLQKFQRSAKAQHHLFERIAMQGMTGANDKIRIVSTIVPSGVYLANSCNYILPDGYDVRYLLGVFNSKLINWYIALRKSGQRFIRLDSFADGYKTADLIAELASPKKRRLSLQIDIQKKLQEGKGAGYERWAKMFNLKQAAEALLYLQEHGIDSYDELETLCADTKEQFNGLSQEIKDCEARLREIADLKKVITTYSKTRDVYVEYRKSGYSKKFLAEHRAEINLHKTAKAKFDALGLEKLPRVSELSAEYDQVLAKKKAAYSRYKEVRRDMGDLLIAKQNVDLLLSDDAGRKHDHEQKR